MTFPTQADPTHALRYPPAPWRLIGWGAQTFAPLALDVARRYVPSGAEPMRLWRGSTLASLYFGAYTQGALVYHELIIAVAIVRIGGRLGFWLPRLYVDNPASVAGGRDIWGLPKRPAVFDVGFTKEERRVRVYSEQRLVCDFAFGRPAFSVPAFAPLRAFGRRDDEALFFRGEVRALVGPVRVRAALPLSDDFAPLRFERCRFGLAYDRLRLSIPAPHAALPIAGTRSSSKPLKRNSTASAPVSRAIKFTVSIIVDASNREETA